MKKVFFYSKLMTKESADARRAWNGTREDEYSNIILLRYRDVL